MKLKYFLIAFFIVFVEMASAQTNVLDNTSLWTSHSQVELFSGQTISDTVLISINKTSLIMEQDGIERTFSIENVTGTWQNVNDLGMLSFEIPSKGFKGIGTIQRSSSGVTLTLDFSSRTNGMKRTFMLTARQ